MALVALAVLLSYLLGAVPFSLIVARMHGVDLRQHGSGNAGATNVLRVLGKGPGLVAFGLDFAKGLVPTLLAPRLVSAEAFGPDGAAWVAVAAGVAAIVGHVVTLWGRLFFGSWKGGKGVATGTGMIAGLIPVATLVAVAVFALAMAATRWVSLGSMLATLSLPLSLGVQTLLGARFAAPVWGFALVVPLFIVWTHRANVRRIADGTEPRLSDKADKLSAGGKTST